MIDTNRIREDFKAKNRILTLPSYLELVEHNPDPHKRSAMVYARDMMEASQTTFVTHPMTGKTLRRSALFEQKANITIYGQSQIMDSIYHAVDHLTRAPQKMIVLHGPNGSGKSSLIRAFMDGLEQYAMTDAGALYTLSWVFSSDMPHLGLADQKHDTKILGRIPCEWKDSPLALVPNSGYHLCHRCEHIFSALLEHYHGDFEQIVRHVEVRRLFLSRMYRKGLVTIEPQMHTDAINQPLMQQIYLPEALSGVPLSISSGDLVDGNRGAIEYADFLKRPIESLKYLLTMAETGSVSIGNTIARIDAVLLGSVNEPELQAFRSYQDYPSYKGRMEYIETPYLLQFEDEAALYVQCFQAKHLAPETAKLLALAVTSTRIMPIPGLSLLEKVRLYGTGEIPSRFAGEERAKLQASKKELFTTRFDPYEGSFGLSPRDAQSIIMHLEPKDCIHPVHIFQALESVPLPDGVFDELKQGYMQTLETQIRKLLGHNDHLELKLARAIEGIIQLAQGTKTETKEATLAFERSILGTKNLEPEKLHEMRQNIVARIGAWAIDHQGMDLIYGSIFPDFLERMEQQVQSEQQQSLRLIAEALRIYSPEHQHETEGEKLLLGLLKGFQENGYCGLCAREVLGYYTDHLLCK